MKSNLAGRPDIRSFSILDNSDGTRGNVYECLVILDDEDYDGFEARIITTDKGLFLSFGELIEHDKVYIVKRIVDDTSDDGDSILIFKSHHDSGDIRSDSFLVSRACSDVVGCILHMAPIRQ